MNTNLATILTICAMLAVGSVQADDLLIDKVDQSAAERDARPPRGATMGSVETRFGKPAMRNDAVRQLLVGSMATSWFSLSTTGSSTPSKSRITEANPQGSSRQLISF